MFHAIILLFFISDKNYLKSVPYFSKIYGTKVNKMTLNGLNVSSISEVCISTILFLLMVRNVRMALGHEADHSPPSSAKFKE
jgi:hypothetical protein